MNLKAGDIAHLRVEFVRPSMVSPLKEGVFKVDRGGGFEFYARLKDVVHVEPKPLAIGDPVITPEGTKGKIVGILDDTVWVNLGYLFGQPLTSFYHVETLTRG